MRVSLMSAALVHGVEERIKLTEADLKATQTPSGGPKEPEVSKLFRLVMKMQASDIHLKVGQPPMMRLRGDIRRMDMRVLTQEDMERLLLPALQPQHKKILDDEG